MKKALKRRRIGMKIYPASWECACGFENKNSWSCMGPNCQ
jgi:hypothetical protein